MPISLQEAAAQYANTTVAGLNSAVANLVGVTVMWFRATPDKRSQDVIFQSYTLWGVEDCPLEFNAVYADTGYDDAAITYNIMGLEYAVPLTLEIAVNTWYEVTNNDGTLPQRGDIVFIPISNKLVEVVSMTPVKKLGAQLTSFKVNCSIYKPTRSRLVGDNLRDSIKNHTVNLKSQFGEDIVDTIENIVDNPQLGIFDSTPNDPYKENAKYRKPGELVSNVKVNNIISHDLEVDGHLVARTYYNMGIDEIPAIKYKNINDVFEADSTRCYTCWLNIDDFPQYKNLKSIEPIKEGNKQYLKIASASNIKYKLGDKVVIERGNLLFCGTIVDDKDYRVEVDRSLVGMLDRKIPNWYKLPGYTIRKDNVINLLKGENENGKLTMNLQGNNYIYIELGDKHFNCQLPIKLKANTWYGLIINIGDPFSAAIFEGSEELKKVGEVSNVKFRLDMTGTYTSYAINPSPCKMTNIRYYNREMTDLDKQIINLVSYNIVENGDAIINDSADLYINKEHIEIFGKYGK